jgi:RNA polymerase sigma factor (sigma-70 family)
MTFLDDLEILAMIAQPASKDVGYRHLIGKYKEKLYWHIRRMVDDHDDTDDILQNTFIKVVRSLDGFQQQSTLYTWMYRIATNESLNFIKSKKNKQSEPLDHVKIVDIRDSQYFDENSALIHLQTAINALPEKQKLVFNLRYYDEMPYQEIADITETSVGALKASYHHAVKKIEEHLKATV